MALDIYNGPQLEDVSPIPTNFGGLSDEEAIDVIKDWFFENFEDPVHHAPYDSAEGGYQYIWGGPYSATEILYDAFDGVADYKIIAAAIRDLESDGTTEWTTSSSRILPPEEDYIQDDVKSLHTQMIQKIANLENILEHLSSGSPGVGHNRPPEPIEDGALGLIEINNISVNLHILKEQPYDRLDKPEEVSKAVEELEITWRKIGKYLLKKGDVLVDEAVKELGKRGAQLAILSSVYDLIREIIVSANDWLHAVGMFSG